MIFKFRVLFDLDFGIEFQTLQDFNVEVIPQASWRFKRHGLLELHPENPLKCQVEMCAYLERDSWQEVMDVVAENLNEHFPDRHFIFQKMLEEDVEGKMPENWQYSNLTEDET